MNCLSFCITSFLAVWMHIKWEICVKIECCFCFWGLSEDQIKAKFDSDSNRVLKSDASVVPSAPTALTAAVSSAQNPDVAKPTVATAVVKKPTKTIVMTKSQYEAMVRNMKEADFGRLGKMPAAGVAGRTRPNLPVGQEQFSSSSQRTGAFAVPSTTPRSTEPQFQPRGRFTSRPMARPQKVAAAMPVRAATTASTLAPRLCDSGARQRAASSFVWQSKHVVRPTIRQNASAIASANLNRVRQLFRCFSSFQLLSGVFTEFLSLFASRGFFCFSIF